MKKNEIELSDEFKTQTIKSIASIILFIVSYLLMFFAAIGLSILSVYGAFQLIKAKPSPGLIIVGIAISSFGLIILLFLVKFLFKSSKVDRSHLIEINRHSEPKLFEVIEEIAKEVGTKFPKKVYLSSDVNASVFYDSQFWSLFLPVRKNLQIGLGLVNSVTEQELRAILAHEFGHFSQRTMKVGSFVYKVNQVIHNLLFDNESYERMLGKWLKINGVIAVVSVLAYRVVQGIQWVLKKIYNIVNLSYMGLSREMEFHADEIAASVTGYLPIKHSLLRASLADHSFNTVLSFYESKILESKKTDNIYRDHSFVMEYIAKLNQVRLVGGFPVVTEETLEKFNKSKLVIKDQWSTHPSTEDRIAYLESNCEPGDEVSYVPANTLFKDLENTQKELTDLLFKFIEYKETPVNYTLDEFKLAYEKGLEESSFPAVYNGYYDVKNLNYFDFESSVSADVSLKHEDLFSNEKVDFIYVAQALQNDIETLNQVDAKLIPVKTFDYDGKRYKRSEAKDLIEKLNLEKEELLAKIEANDKLIFDYFSNYPADPDAAEKLKVLYKEFIAFDKIYESDMQIFIELNNGLQFTQVTTPYETIKSNFYNLLPLEEAFKKAIGELIEMPRIEAKVTEEMLRNFDLYLSNNWSYFIDEEYKQDKLDMLYSALNDFSYLLNTAHFELKRRVLVFQEDLLKMKTPV